MNFRITNGSISFGAETILEEINFEVKGKEKVAIVGRNMATKVGMSAKLFSILGKNNINIKVIAQASQELSIIVGVENSQFEKAIKAIYAGLVK